MLSEDALTDEDLRGTLLEECRPESDDVGVGWGKDWGKSSKSNLAASPTRYDQKQEAV